MRQAYGTRTGWGSAPEEIDMETRSNTSPHVTLTGGALVLEKVSIDTPVVMAEALHWTEGRRGVPVSQEQGEGADLSCFAVSALTLGAQMLSYGAEAGGVATLSGTVTQLAARAEAASSALASDVSRASKSATELATSMTREAAGQTAAALNAAAEQAVKEIGGAVVATRTTLQSELTRLLGSEDTPVVHAVQQLVAEQMSASAVNLQRTFTETLGTVSATLDVGNPGSPLAKLETRIGERAERQHREVNQQLERVREAVTAATSAASTAAAVAAAHSASPAKGLPFEERIGEQLEGIAAGLGGTYTSVGSTAGAVRSSKKGDGILEVPAMDGSGPVRVVVEMTTTGASRKWSPYLEEAERNREAQASLGVVPGPELVPGGNLLASVGDNRLVVAADGGIDPGLLRAACVLLVLRAQRDIAARRGGDLTPVDDRLAEAQSLLDALAEILKTAAGVKAGASKVVTNLEAVHASMTRCMLQARATLAPALGAGSTGEAAA